MIYGSSGNKIGYNSLVWFLMHTAVLKGKLIYI